MIVSREQIANGEMIVGDNLDVMKTIPDRYVDAWITSPPYEGQRTYGIDFELIGQSWVDWMIPRVVEACRTSKGLVFVNMSSPVRDYKYSPAVEWLVSDLTRKHGVVCGPSPYAWFKMKNHDDAPGNGQPGSGGPHYHRRDWEPIYAFAFADRLPPPWSDQKAFGEPPREGSFGGEFSNRKTDGSRSNGEKKTRRALAKELGVKTKHVSNSGGGDNVTQATYVHPDICNPGNVIRTTVGGGHIGHVLAHETDAPFPTKLVERFIAWFVPPGGLVGDFFSGSGTVPQVAEEMQRRWIAIDVRPSQADLLRRRLGTVTMGLFS